MRNKLTASGLAVVLNEAMEFTADHAELAGDLVSQTRAFDLSLGDGACGIGIGIEDVRVRWLIDHGNS